jgi:hypothetical protein
MTNKINTATAKTQAERATRLRAIKYFVIAAPSQAISFFYQSLLRRIGGQVS